MTDIDVGDEICVKGSWYVVAEVETSTKYGWVQYYCMDLDTTEWTTIQPEEIDEILPKSY